MRVIFRQDVKGVGKKDEIKEVKEYLRNEGISVRL